MTHYFLKFTWHRPDTEVPKGTLPSWKEIPTMQSEEVLVIFEHEAEHENRIELLYGFACYCYAPNGKAIGWTDIETFGGEHFHPNNIVAWSELPNEQSTHDLINAVWGLGERTI